MKIMEKTVGHDQSDTASSLDNIDSTNLTPGDHNKALEHHERALELNEKTLGPDHPDTASSLYNIAGTYLNLEDHNKALEYHERALKIREKILGPDHLDTATSLNDIGRVYLSLGNNNKALEYHEQAFYIFKKVLGTEDPKMLKLLDNFMNICIRVKKFTKAYNVLSAYLKELPKDHPEYAYLVSFKSRINKEGTQTGFRSPSAQNRNKQKKKRKKK